MKSDLQSSDSGAALLSVSRYVKSPPQGKRHCDSYRVASLKLFCKVIEWNKKNSMVSKPISIRWIRIGSQPYYKIMYIIELQKFSTNIKIKIIKFKSSAPRASNNCFNLTFFILIPAESCL